VDLQVQQEAELEAEPYKTTADNYGKQHLLKCRWLAGVTSKTQDHSVQNTKPGRYIHKFESDEWL